MLRKMNATSATPKLSSCRALQIYSRHSDALSALSSLASLDKVSRRQSEDYKKMTSVTLNLEQMHSQPLPIGIFAERDASVQRTLSQDWLRTTYSPRSEGIRSPRGSFGGGDTQEGLQGGRLSLSSIPEDDEDEGSEASMDELEERLERLALPTARVKAPPARIGAKVEMGCSRSRTRKVDENSDAMQL